MWLFKFGMVSSNIRTVVAIRGSPIFNNIWRLHLASGRFQLANDDLPLQVTTATGKGSFPIRKRPFSIYEWPLLLENGHFQFENEHLPIDKDQCSLANRNYHLTIGMISKDHPIPFCTGSQKHQPLVSICTPKLSLRINIPNQITANTVQTIPIELCDRRLLFQSTYCDRPTAAKNTTASKPSHAVRS